MKRQSEDSIKRVLVIGAGVSGLAAIKSCREENMSVDCFELTDSLGGLWKLNEKDGITTVMETTVMHSSKEMGAYSDFPPPLDFPVFLTNRFQLEYLRLYAEHYGLQKYIQYRHKVLQVMPTPDHENSGKWSARVCDIESGREFERDYDAVMICTGRNSVPRRPKLDGLDKFAGMVLHSNDYKRPNLFKGKRVLVIGFGNSGGDIATELSRVAKQVYLSTRRGCWLLPRIGPKGKPLDVYLFRRHLALLRNFSTYDLTSRVVEHIISDLVDHEKVGLRPRHRLMSQFPLINDQISECLLNGSVQLVGEVRDFTKNSAILESRILEDIDAVILGTGFDTHLNAIMKGILPKEITENLRAYKRVFPLERSHHTLAFVGMIGSFGPLCPPLEMQARWVAAVWSGKAKLPSQKAMAKDARNYEKELEKHAYAESYHRDNVDWMLYMEEISSFFGVKPNLWKMFFQDHRLFWKCLFGPCLPYTYRLQGTHCWDGARNAILTSKYRLHYLCGMRWLKSTTKCSGNLNVAFENTQL